MKKSFINTAAATIAIAASIFAFASCNQTTSSDATETKEVVVFDPTATDTYTVYQDSECATALTAGTDYEIVTEGNNSYLKIAPNGWTCTIVLNEEITCTGATKANVTLYSDASGANMGLNLISSAESNGYSSTLATTASSTATSITDKFGKSYQGTNWTDAGAEYYTGAEAVIKIQPYIQSTTDWQPTTTSTIYVGKVTVLDVPVTDAE